MNLRQGADFNMKNKEFLNVCYKFFNRIITSNQLLEKLQQFDIKMIPQKEHKTYKDFVNNVKEIIASIPNEEDEYVTKNRESVKTMIDKLEAIPAETEGVGKLKKCIANLKEDYNKEMDSYNRWSSLVAYISKNDYFNKSMESLTKYELLEFIAQYMQVEYPPNLTQQEFDELIQVGIEQDKREWLWRLAFNYENTSITFDLIVDYFIKEKDGYYITELISAVGEKLDIDNIIKKITDKELIEDLKTRKDILDSFLTEKQLKDLFDK